MSEKNKKIFGFIADLAADSGFIGSVSIHFQAGEMERIKKYNTLNKDTEFSPVQLTAVFNKITSWQKSKKFGTLTVPIKNNLVSMPEECEIIAIKHLV